MKKMKKRKKELALVPVTTNREVLDDRGLIAKIKMPGLDEKDIFVKVNSGYLEISAGKKCAQERKFRGGYEKIYASAESYQRLPLPRGITSDKISKSYKDGILEVRIIN